MTTRFLFQSADPATFNQLRVDLPSMALSRPLSRAGLRVADMLPAFASRQHDYAFPIDEKLGHAIGTGMKTAKRGPL